jgi:hypothetical protein
MPKGVLACALAARAASGLEDLENRAGKNALRGQSTWKTSLRKQGLRFLTESLILAQGERWRRALDMQVEQLASFGAPSAANGGVTRG